MIRPAKIHALVLGVFLVLMCLPHTGYAGEERASYEDLLASVKNVDPAVNFQALRFAYTQTPQYNPYRPSVPLADMLAALNNKNYAKAIELAEKVLTDNYVTIKAHLVCLAAYRELGDTEKAKYHLFVSRGLLNSLTQSGDGKSPETAYAVISVEEEYDLLYYLGLKMQSQALVHIKDHHYDKLQVNDPRTNTAFALYFCVDRPWNWLQHNRSKLFPEGS